jgi:hypothetical protein
LIEFAVPVPKIQAFWTCQRPGEGLQKARKT